MWGIYQNNTDISSKTQKHTSLNVKTPISKIDIIRTVDITVFHQKNKRPTILSKRASNKVISLTD